jgi:hypothetical protein
MAEPTQRTRAWDPAAPFLVFLAGGVVVVLAVLAFLTYEEGRPRHVEALAQNVPVRLLPALPPAIDPQPLPVPLRPRAP